MVWRLIRSGGDNGPMNMAMDEAILRAVARREVPPTLRLYAWAPPCLSLGRGQPVEDIDRNAVEAAGYGLVRRPTGGRAILHIDELTYSIVASDQHPQVRGSVVESYRRLSAGLVLGLERLGVTQVEAEERAARRGAEGPVCFEVPSDYEITVGGKKLVGSAQMRAQGVVLQHGAIPLHGDIARICPLLTSHPDPAQVRSRATTVERTLGRRVGWEEAAEAVAEGFAQALGLRLQVGGLSPDELASARGLCVDKYGNDSWTRIT